jgi:hypothetical protein
VQEQQQLHLPAVLLYYYCHYLTPLLPDERERKEMM